MNEAESPTPAPVPGASPASVLKHIVCQVGVGDHQAFDDGQRAWQGLAGIPGFRGQTGGWSLDQDQDDHAVILGFWRDDAAVERFMAERHDELFAASGQQALIQDLQVTLWHRVEGLGAGAPLAEVAGRDGGFLRIAEARLLPAQLPHFEHVQRTVWDPAMEAAGVLASGLWRSDLDPERFLALSLWRSRQSERAWRNGPFFDCWRRAGVEDDCEEVTGRLVSVAPEWRVDWPRN